MSAKGGSWKVAYADFVTTMMALFMVLWLTQQSDKVKKSVERAFQNPGVGVTQESSGIVAGGGLEAVKAQSLQGKKGAASANEVEVLRRLTEDLLKALQADSDAEETDTVKLEMTNEGLLISVFDNNRKPLFERDSANFTEYGRWVFSTLTWEICRYRGFPLELGGHTERGRPSVREDYSDWEITADRANAVRRLLLKNGVRSEQIKKVAGHADTVPLPNTRPEEERNRRVTVLLRLIPESARKDHQTHG
jgi:chemotaxis protein MotB